MRKLLNVSGILWLAKADGAIEVVYQPASYTTQGKPTSYLPVNTLIQLSPTNVQLEHI